MKKELSICFVLTIALLLSSIVSKAQLCGFDESRKKLQQQPGYLQQEIDFEKRIKLLIKNGSLNAKAGTVYTIPVVVHVLHLGEAVGTGTNIADAQIQSGIDRLNTVYRGLDPSSTVDFEVEFSLAKRDPSCNASTGINRIDASGVTNYSAAGVLLQSVGADENTLKDLSRWPETDYLNIWIVSEIDNNGGGAGIQGYANFYNGNAYEGSVMMYTVFGYDPTNATPAWPLNFSRDNSTVIHEFGHYMHLYHTFQGDGGGGGCPGDVTVGVDSDGCADTEIHRRLTSTCPANNDCNANNPYGDNTLKNYMSYFSCTDRLTTDQKTRVRAALLGTSLVASKGALVPDPGYAAPVAVCSANTVTTTNAGITGVELNGVTFSSGSSNADGGNIDKSASCSGYYEIDATVANTLNVAMFSVNFQQLGVWIDWNDDGDFLDDSEQQHLSEDIAGAASVPINLNYPTTIPYDDYVRLRLITDLDDRYGPGDINSSCYSSLIYGQSEDYTIYIQPNALPVELIDFHAIAINNKSVQLKWETATEINNDYFTIEKSKDGGNWEFLSKIAGAGNSSSVLSYKSIDNAPYSGTSFYRLKQTDFDGNYTYSSIKAVILNEKEDIKLSIYPNPNEGKYFFIKMNKQFLKNAKVVVTDISGRIILTQELNKTEGNNTIIKFEDQLPSGFYIVTVTSRNQKATEKLIIQ